MTKKKRYAPRHRSFYEKKIKRPLDYICALSALIVLSPIMFITALLVKIKLGSPVIFKQERPGLNGKIFLLYKFRTMTDAVDENGNLLPDDVRLTSFGSKLRNTSLDELPELFNILKGDMSIVGPRPQLVRDMVFMTSQQQQRHSVLPGLTGLAQVKGRNAIDWEKKLEYDLKYIRHITFGADLRIILMTIKTAVFRHEGITEDGFSTAEDYGDYLFNRGKIDMEEYKKRQEEAIHLLEHYKRSLKG